jgi:hypothetical protein
MVLASLRMMALGPPSAERREAYVRDAPVIGSRVGSLHFRNFELVTDNQVLSWHIAGARSAALRGAAAAPQPEALGGADPAQPAPPDRQDTAAQNTRVRDRPARGGWL